MKNNFVGFASSDKFLAAVDQSKPVNLSVHRKHGKNDKYGLSVDSTVLTISQVCENEIIYFQHAVDRYQCLSGSPMERDEQKPAKIAERVLELAEKYLNNHGLSWREALVSIPANYTTLDGETTFLKYVKEDENYIYVES